MRTALVVASIVCAATTARAQEAVVLVDEQPAPLVMTEADPATTEEYQARMAQLKDALRAARTNDDGASQADLLKRIASLRTWAKVHLHKQDPSLVAGGYVLLGLGGASFIGGTIVLTVGAFSNCHAGFILAICSGDSSMMITGGVMMGIGAAVALLSIPIILSGNKKVMDAPHANVVVGPARVGLSVTF